MNRSEYDDFDPTCDRTSCALRIFSGSLLPHDVEAAIGIEPTSISIKGRKVPMPNGREITEQANAFFVQSEDFVESRDLRRHVDWVLERVAGSEEAIRSLWQRGDVQASFTCNWWSAEGRGGPRLRTDQLAALADLDVEIGFSFAYYGPESEK